MEKLKVLIIDDSFQDSKQQLLNFYNSNYYDTIIATSISDSKDKIKNEKYDFISLDCNLSKFPDFGHSDNEFSVFSDIISLINEMEKHVVILSATAFNPGDNNQYFKTFYQKKIKTLDFLDFNLLHNIDNDPSIIEQYYNKYKTLIESNPSSYYLEDKQGKEIIILHISDLEFSNPSISANRNNVELLIKEFLVKNNYNNVDIIIASGDMSYQGNPDGFSKALDFFNTKLSSLFHYDLRKEERWRKRVLLVPGNHDVNLTLDVANNYVYSPKNDGSGDIIDLNFGFLKPRNRKYNFKYKYQDFKSFAYNLTHDYNWLKENHLNFVNKDFSEWGLQFFLLNGVKDLAFDNRKTRFDEDNSPKISNLKHTINFYLNHFPTIEMGLIVGDEDQFDIAAGKIRANQKDNNRPCFWLCGDKHVYDYKDKNSFESTFDNFHQIMAPSLFLSSRVNPNSTANSFEGFNLYIIDEDRVKMRTISCKIERTEISTQKDFDIDLI